MEQGDGRKMKAMTCHEGTVVIEGTSYSWDLEMDLAVCSNDKS